MKLLANSKVWLVALLLTFSASSAMAQANSTFNGRILDQEGGVLPGVTVIVVNLNTGVVRESVTTSQGLQHARVESGPLQRLGGVAGLRAPDAGQCDAAA